MINNLRKVLLKIMPFVLFILMSGYSFGQNSNKKKSNDKPFKERLFVGGSFGFSLGSISSSVEVAPILGYAVSKDFIVGLGFIYRYIGSKDYYYNIDNGESFNYSTNLYGGSIWARYFLSRIGIPVIENLFLHAEIEPLIYDESFKYDPYNGDYIDIYGNLYVKEKYRQTFTGFYLGGGLRQMLGQRSYMYLEVLWNFNEELYTPYSNPRIRIGVAVGL